MSATTPVLELKGILKDYPGVRAVDYVDLVLMPGEVHALVGENGAGKSTLIKIMAGVVAPDTGQIQVRGQPVEIESGQDSYQLGLSFIHQELNLVPYLDGAENIFLGRPYPQTRLGTVNWRELRARASDIMALLGASIPVDVPVGRLSPGDQAMISIARALAGEASIYVMDEPTASLASQEIERLFAVIRSLKAQGATVVYVSHRLDEVFEIADRVTVMRDGAVVGTRETGDITHVELIRLMIGRKMDEAYPSSKATIGRPVLQAKALTGDAVRNISFTLHQGEVLGVAGLVGAGRSELLRMIFGVDPIQSGSIVVNGNPTQPTSPAAAIRRGIVLVPEERRTQGLVLTRPIVENITLAHLGTLATRGVFLNRSREREASQEVGEAVRLIARSLQQRVEQLSGGNQQKVVFAKWLLGEAQVLMLDEPTRGVDVGARFEIYTIIRDLAAQGTGILLVSSDLSELLGLADRLVVLREGEMVAELTVTAELTQETVLTYYYGGKNDKS